MGVIEISGIIDVDASLVGVTIGIIVGVAVGVPSKIVVGSTTLLGVNTLAPMVSSDEDIGPRRETDATDDNTSEDVTKEGVAIGVTIGVIIDTGMELGEKGRDV